MGMSAVEVVRKVELPLAVPTIMTGVRTAAINIVATATLGPLVGQLTLGDFIISRNVYGDEGVLAGAILVALLVLAVELALAGVQRLLTPRGLALQRAGRGRIGFPRPRRAGMSCKAERGPSMSTKIRLRALFALLAVAALSRRRRRLRRRRRDDDLRTAAGLIESNPDNSGVQITVGSKNFTEQFILGEIYAQGLEAAGYDVSTDLNLGDETVALKALKAGEIDGYPEYTSTALTSFFDTNPEDVPSDAQQAYESSKADFDRARAWSPTRRRRYNSANAVGTLTSTADELGLENVSDLEGQSQDLTLYGSPECRQRPDCLVGLEDGYGLEFKSFTPVDIALRYEVLDKGQADLSILFTSDALLFTEPGQVHDPRGRPGHLPGREPAVRRPAGDRGRGRPDFGETIEQVQGNLTLKVMQELNARVDIDKEKPADVARDYLVSSGLRGVAGAEAGAQSRLLGHRAPGRGGRRGRPGCRARRLRLGLGGGVVRLRRGQRARLARPADRDDPARRGDHAGAGPGAGRRRDGRLHDRRAVRRAVHLRLRPLRAAGLRGLVRRPVREALGPHPGVHRDRPPDRRPRGQAGVRRRSTSSCRFPAARARR